MCCIKSAGKLCPVSLGIAIGAVKGLYLLALAWIAFFFDYGTETVKYIASYHHFYSASLKGGVAGGISGFVCGFLLGFFIGFIYNWIQSRCENAKKA